MPARKTAKKAPMQLAARQIGRYIAADPQVCHGKLTFRGTRIFVSDVLEQVEIEIPWDVIVDEWGARAPHEAIAEALRLPREAFLEHATEYSPPRPRRRAARPARRAAPAHIPDSSASHKRGIMMPWMRMCRSS